MPLNDRVSCALSSSTINESRNDSRFHAWFALLGTIDLHHQRQSVQHGHNDVSVRAAGRLSHGQLTRPSAVVRPDVELDRHRHAHALDQGPSFGLLLRHLADELRQALEHFGDRRRLIVIVVHSAPLATCVRRRGTGLWRAADALLQVRRVQADLLIEDDAEAVEVGALAPVPSSKPRPRPTACEGVLAHDAELAPTKCTIAGMGN